MMNLSVIPRLHNGAFSISYSKVKAMLQFRKKWAAAQHGAEPYSAAFPPV